MKILAIETSCDDTGIALLEVKGLLKPSFSVLSNIVSSQIIHANYGGVFPMMAKREHQNNLVPALKKALQQADLLQVKPQKLTQEQISTLKEIFKKEDHLFERAQEFFQTYIKPPIDAIAVTNGPGLEPCLWVGVNFAKALSYLWNISIIPANHIEAHILVNFLATPNIKFPAISLIVSGGHTQLVLVQGVGNYEIVGETRDDAAGECFDKTARILGLGYPGGPIISKIAASLKESSIALPRPMISSHDFDFSFSGLKTAVLYTIKKTDEKTAKSQKFINQMSFSVQNAICDVLVKKTLQAAKKYQAKSIILGGGVSANQELRKQFTEKSPVPVIFPEPKLSTDNGLMIAVAGYFNRTKKIAWQKLSVNANMRVGE